LCKVLVARKKMDQVKKGIPFCSKQYNKLVDSEFTLYQATNHMDMCHAILQDNGISSAIDNSNKVDTEGALGEAFDAEQIVKKVMPEPKNSYIMAKIIQNICKVYL